MSKEHPPGAGTRAQILDVALELIAEKGFGGTSTRELSERLGFTKAALYYHFRTKDDLLTALISPVLEDLSALVSGTGPRPSVTRRRQLLVGYVDLVARHGRLIRVLSKDPSTANRPGCSRALPLYQQLIELLSGSCGPEASQQVRARAAVGSIHASILYPAPGENPTIAHDLSITAACGALGIAPPRRH